MNQVLTRAHDRLQSIRIEIEKLVDERESISNFLHVYATFAGDETQPAATPAAQTGLVENQAPSSVVPEAVESTAGEVGAPASPAPVSEKAGGTPLAGGETAIPPATTPAAPATVPDKPMAEQAKHAVEDALSSASGGMHDGLPVHPATSSPSGKSTRAKAFVAPAGEERERTHKREEIASLHEQEPWLTPEQAASRALVPVVNLRIFSEELQITWSQPRPPAPAEAPARRKGLNNEVRACHEEHPDWPAAKIAAELNCGVEYIRTTAARLKITLPTIREHQPRGPISLRERVLTLHRQHPTWTPRMIASELGAKLGSVRVYITGENRERAAAPAVDEGAMQAEAIERKRRLGVAV